MKMTAMALVASLCLAHAASFAADPRCGAALAAQREIVATGMELLVPARRLAGLVDVLGVARRAARLLHLIVNHRHDRVVGDAALTRAVVVQNVTEPKPALLPVHVFHQLRVV